MEDRRRSTSSLPSAGRLHDSMDIHAPASGGGGSSFGGASAPRGDPSDPPPLAGMSARVGTTSRASGKPPRRKARGGGGGGSTRSVSGYDIGIEVQNPTPDTTPLVPAQSPPHHHTRRGCGGWGGGGPPPLDLATSSADSPRSGGGIGFPGDESIPELTHSRLHQLDLDRDIPAVQSMGTLTPTMASPTWGWQTRQPPDVALSPQSQSHPRPSKTAWSDTHTATTASNPPQAGGGGGASRRGVGDSERAGDDMPPQYQDSRSTCPQGRRGGEGSGGGGGGGGGGGHKDGRRRHNSTDSPTITEINDPWSQSIASRSMSMCQSMLGQEAQQVIHQSTSSYAQGPRASGRGGNAPRRASGAEGAPEEPRGRMSGDAGSGGDPAGPPHPEDDVSSNSSFDLGDGAIAGYRLREIYDRLDVKQRNHVTRANLIRALHQDPEVRALMDLPAQITQSSDAHTDFERLFQLLDRDGDRGISWEDFRDLFFSCTHSAFSAKQRPNFQYRNKSFIKRSHGSYRFHEWRDQQHRERKRNDKRTRRESQQAEAAEVAEMHAEEAARAAAAHEAREVAAAHPCASPSSGRPPPVPGSPRRESERPVHRTPSAPPPSRQSSGRVLRGESVLDDSHTNVNVSRGPSNYLSPPNSEVPRWQRGEDVGDDDVDAEYPPEDRAAGGAPHSSTSRTASGRSAKGSPSWGQPLEPREEVPRREPPPRRTDSGRSRQSWQDDREPQHNPRFAADDDRMLLSRTASNRSAPRAPVDDDDDVDYDEQGRVIAREQTVRRSVHDDDRRVVPRGGSGRFEVEHDGGERRVLPRTASGRSRQSSAHSPQEQQHRDAHDDPRGDFHSPPSRGGSAAGLHRAASARSGPRSPTGSDRRIVRRTPSGRECTAWEDDTRLSSRQDSARGGSSWDRNHSADIELDAREHPEPGRRVEHDPHGDEGLPRRASARSAKRSVFSNDGEDYEADRRVVPRADSARGSHAYSEVRRPSWQDAVPAHVRGHADHAHDQGDEDDVRAVPRRGSVRSVGGGGGGYDGQGQLLPRRGSSRRDLALTRDLADSSSQVNQAVDRYIEDQRLQERRQQEYIDFVGTPNSAQARGGGGPEADRWLVLSDGDDRGRGGEYRRQRSQAGYEDGYGPQQQQQQQQQPIMLEDRRASQRPPQSRVSPPASRGVSAQNLRLHDRVPSAAASPRSASHASMRAPASATNSSNALRLLTQKISEATEGMGPRSAGSAAAEQLADIVSDLRDVLLLEAGRTGGEPAPDPDAPRITEQPPHFSHASTHDDYGPQPRPRPSDDYGPHPSEPLRLEPRHSQQPALYVEDRRRQSQASSQQPPQGGQGHPAIAYRNDLSLLRPPSSAAHGVPHNALVQRQASHNTQYSAATAPAEEWAVARRPSVQAVVRVDTLDGRETEVGVPPSPVPAPVATSPAQAHPSEPAMRMLTDAVQSLHALLVEEKADRIRERERSQHRRDDASVDASSSLPMPLVESVSLPLLCDALLERASRASSPQRASSPPPPVSEPTDTADLHRTPPPAHTASYCVTEYLPEKVPGSPLRSRSASPHHSSVEQERAARDLLRDAEVRELRETVAELKEQMRQRDVAAASHSSIRSARSAQSIEKAAVRQAPAPPPPTAAYMDTRRGDMAVQRHISPPRAARVVAEAAPSLRDAVQQLREELRRPASGTAVPNRDIYSPTLAAGGGGGGGAALPPQSYSPLSPPPPGRGGDVGAPPLKSPVVGAAAGGGGVWENPASPILPGPPAPSPVIPPPAAATAGPPPPPPPPLALTQPTQTGLTRPPMMHMRPTISPSRVVQRQLDPVKPGFVKAVYR